LKGNGGKPSGPQLRLDLSLLIALVTFSLVNVMSLSEQEEAQ